ncbi:MAG: DUF2326 domain-containing protein [Candidatus Gracilibacteria bacterium]
MLLHKLYLEPQSYFEPIEFKLGFNFIYAKKDQASDKKKSLNGVGKSLLLNLIDFCLLSSETEHIKSAKKNNNLVGHYVVLEFSVNGENYIIKRPFYKPNQSIFFGKINEELLEYKHSDVHRNLSQMLCDLIFKTPYTGKYSNTWLRKLMPFFMKIQSGKNKVNFKDPINYLSSTKEMELISYHLFLLGIDNSLFFKNFEVMSLLKEKIPALGQVKSLVTESYELDVDQAENEITKLRGQIKKFEDQIEKFKLAKQYENVEQESNALTGEIKKLLFENYQTKKKIESYEASFTIDNHINVTKIANAYKDLNKLLAENIKKTLNEAIAFRKSLAESRKEFLRAEINALLLELKDREDRMTKLEEERARLFRFLDADKAINELSEAYLNLGEKKTYLGKMEGTMRIYRDLKREIADLNANANQIYAEIESLMDTIQITLDSFRSLFFEVHDAIYTENPDQAQFIFNTNPKKDSKLNINVELPSELAYGKNRGRTLVYDITVLLHLVQQNINAPHFLVHDGIFDGIDRSHFIALYNYLSTKTKDSQFQYIITFNQEGTVKDLDFGEGAEELTTRRIEHEAIITLSSSKPLFGHKWK